MMINLSACNHIMEVIYKVYYYYAYCNLSDNFLIPLGTSVYLYKVITYQTNRINLLFQIPNFDYDWLMNKSMQII